jgi:hypothetical protein
MSERNEDDSGGRSFVARRPTEGVDPSDPNYVPSFKEQCRLHLEKFPPEDDDHEKIRIISLAMRSVRGALDLYDQEGREELIKSIFEARLELARLDNLDKEEE